MPAISAIDISPINVLSSVIQPKEVLTPEEKRMQQMLFEQKQFLTATAKPALSHAVDARRRYDYEWMVRDLFRRGYQFNRYQPTTQTVLLASRQTARIPINITLSQMRSIRNQVTSFRPKFETMPRYPTTESTTQARYSGKLLDYYFDHLNLKKKVKETVIQGLMYSVGGPWQIVYDQDKEEIRVWLIDPFDFYFDPLAEELEDAEYCIKAVRRSLFDVIYNEEYNSLARKEVTGGEARLAVSEYKQFMLQALKYVTQFNRDEAPTLILFEGYFRIRDKDTGKQHLRKVIWTDQNSYPLVYEDLDTNDYDFVIYHADLNPKEIYGESWMKHVMPINRVINSLESSVFDYNYKVAKGRLVVDRDSGVRAIHNVHGEIISKNRGAEVRALDMPPLPIAVESQINRMGRYIEDIGGAHDASLGRVPAGVKCVDLSTKCLTKEGFKSVDELRLGEEIYTVNQQTLRGEWKPLKNIHQYNAIRTEIYTLKNKNIDAVVTANHKWFVKQLSGSGKVTHSLVETQKAALQHSILLGARYDQPFVDKAYDDNFVKLVGWTITEGTYPKDKPNMVSISQSYRANPEKVEMIKDTISSLTSDYYIMNSKSNFGTRVNFAYGLGKTVRAMFPEKVLTYDFINALTIDQIKLLKDTLILGDGSVRGNNERFFTTDTRMIDIFTYICVLLGYTTHVTKYNRSVIPNRKDYYEISVKKSKYTDAFNTNRKKSYIERYNALTSVWCPETDNGTFIAERNGSIYVTGNSGIGVAELKQADATSQDDLVDNLEDFLTEVGQKILRKIADNYKKPKVIRDLGFREEEAQYFAVIGQDFVPKKKEQVPGHENQLKIGPDWLDIASIGKDNTIRVTIGSWLGYTKEMMQEKTLKLLQLGAIDQKTFLTLWEFGDVSKIVEQTRVEQLFKSHLGQQSGDVKQVDPNVENDMMVNEGKPIMPDQHDDHWVHVAIHQQALGQGRDDLVGQHIQGHLLYEGQMPTTPVDLSQQQAQAQQQSGGMGQQQPISPQDQGRLQALQQQQLPPPQQNGQLGSQQGMPPIGIS